LSYVVTGVYCAWMLQRAVAVSPKTTVAPGGGQLAAPPATGEPDGSGMVNISLWTHVRRAWVPIAALIVIAVLQNIDIIAAKHRFGGIENLASSYAATAVAAKVLVWIAIGASFYLVPEVSRRHHEGEDTRPVLARAVAIIAVCAVPVLLIFAFGSHQLIQAAFGHKRLKATDSLFPLGCAFALLACTYLAIQYMLALKRKWFLLPLALVAVAEPILLLHAPAHPAGFATVVLAVQAVAAALAFAMALRPDVRTRPSPTSGDAVQLTPDAPRSG
jgi:O-antigen/teichoic acid export membrane protein